MLMIKYGIIIFIMILFIMLIYISNLEDKDDNEEIQYLLIPRLTKVVINSDDIYNTKSSIGDIIEVCNKNGKKTYYIHAHSGYYRLTYKQIMKLEFDYRIKII